MLSRSFCSDPMEQSRHFGFLAHESKMSAPTNESRTARPVTVRETIERSGGFVALC